MPKRLTVVSKPEKQFLHDAVFAAERAKGKKLSGPEKQEVLRLARQQLLSQRVAERLNRYGLKSVRLPNSLGISPNLSDARQRRSPQRPDRTK